MNGRSAFIPVLAALVVLVAIGYLWFGYYGSPPSVKESLGNESESTIESSTAADFGKADDVTSSVASSTIDSASEWHIAKLLDEIQNVPQINKRDVLDALRRNVVTRTEDYIAAKEKISVATEEVLVYLERMRQELNVDEAQFQEIKKSSEAHFNAVKAVYEKKMSAKEAANTYMGDYGGANVWEKILKQDATKQKIEMLERMLPKDIPDMLDKSVEGSERLALRIKIIEALRPATIQNIDSLSTNDIEWRGPYERFILEYAQTNLVGTYLDSRFKPIVEQLLSGT